MRVECMPPGDAQALGLAEGLRGAWIERARSGFALSFLGSRFGWSARYCIQDLVYDSSIHAELY